jgi:hypothetical protein
MDCAQARRLLWPPERPLLAGDEVVRAREHVRACAGCRSYLTLDRALLSLYDRSRRTEAPAAVRERVFDALAGGPTSPPVESPDVFVEDYLRRAVGQDRIETSDPTAVRRFLERELGLTFDPIRLAGLALERAEICLRDGRRGAMIVYEADGVPVSHYIVPRHDVGARAPDLSPRREGSTAEMPVVTWATSDAEQALVGGLSPEQLLEIAEHAASKE